MMKLSKCDLLSYNGPPQIGCTDRDQGAAQGSILRNSQLVGI